MYELEIIGTNGTLTFGMDSPYTIDQIEGLAPPEADIHLHQMALLDGQRYNGAKAQIRTLRIAFAIEWDVEKSRLEAYKVLRIKKPVTVHYKSDERDVQILGYVQSVNVDHFSMKQVVTAVLLCPEPYWQGIAEVVDELTQTVKNFRFPFYSTVTEPIVFGYLQNLAIGTVENTGEVETGVIFHAAFRSDVEDLQVINYTTGEQFGVTYSFETGDELTIDTTKGEKTVFLLRDGQVINLFNYIDENSVWLDLGLGETTFVFTVTSGLLSDVTIDVRHRDLYEGV